MFLLVGTSTYPLPIRKRLTAQGELTSAKVLFASVAGPTKYLIIEVAGSTWPNGAHINGFCGAGEEDDLVWLRLDENYKVSKVQAILWASCYDIIEPVESIVDPDRIALDLKYVRRCREMKCSFDARHPDQGLKIREVPWPTDEPCKPL